MTSAARVVPDVASFSVDDGFWYSIPDHLSPDLQLGSIVRVPLSGRRVRGWVVELGERKSDRLKDVAGISGALPVVDKGLLDSLRWASHHYVSPFSGMLSRATPPNLPKAIPAPASVAEQEPEPTPLDELITRTAQSKTTPVTAVVANWHDMRWLRALGPVFESGQSVQLVVASVAEAEAIEVRARELWADLVVVVTGEDDAADTAAWEMAQSSPRLVVGTPKTSTWLVRDLGLAVVLEESRRAMKDRQTPTVHVRDLLRTRSRIEGFNLAFLGPTPSVELLAAGAEVVTTGRPWSLVEIVDRTDDPPGSGFLSDRAEAAIVAAARDGRKVFVFTHRRVGYASRRCASCRLLRTCANCGARLGRNATCSRCQTPTGPCERCGGTEFEEMGTVPDRLAREINRRAGSGIAATFPSDANVTVGTERDLAGLGEVYLAVAADVDGMLMGSGHRTSEEALRQLARLGSLVGSGRGARLILQTSRPDSLLITTMRRGEPIPYLERVLVERAREGAPPSSDMIIIEVRDQIPESAGADLGTLDPEATVLGPMTVEGGVRWLLTGKLGKARLQLRKVVGRWRDKGATVRVDVDPIDM